MLMLSMKKSFCDEKRWPGGDHLGKKNSISLVSVGKGWIEQLLPMHPLDPQLHGHQEMLRVAKALQGGDQWSL